MLGMDSSEIPVYDQQENTALTGFGGGGELFRLEWTRLSE
jgi:hypothetical protein